MLINNLEHSLETLNEKFKTIENKSNKNHDKYDKYEETISLLEKRYEETINRLEINILNIT